MKTRVTKWGNSLAVRIPQPIAESASFRDGDEVELKVSRSGVVTLKSHRSIPTLEELVKDIRREDRHGEEVWGKPKGKEIW
jgi:antitoxin MazE